ncbi:MAG TPA: metallophosphoesterase [candidate division Zixibacteria bacterium]|nr:metallophosphoesterase [candidate division Zixibacteria bacterium]
MKLLLFADLHLDAPFAWASPEAARTRRQNRRETLGRILRLADEERVDAILCAGDLFEHERISPDTMEFLRASFADAGRPVFLAPGNHDWLSPRSPYAVIDWSPNVHVFTEARLTPVTLADGLTLWGAAHRAPANTDGFFAGFRTDRGGVHLALAHASERSQLAWQESGKEPHAPFDASEIAAAGLHHAFLGHYHRPRDAERHTYPGNPDPLEFGEEGERGAVLVEVAADGSVSRERRRVAVSEVHDITVVLDGAGHFDAVREAVAAAIAGLGGCVRVTLEGEVAPSVQLDLRELGRLGAHLDGLALRTGRVAVGYDLQAIAAEQTVRGQFARDAREQVEDPELRRRVILTGLRALEGRADLEVV